MVKVQADNVRHKVKVQADNLRHKYKNLKKQNNS